MTDVKQRPERARLLICGTHQDLPIGDIKALTEKLCAEPANIAKELEKPNTAICCMLVGFVVHREDR